MDEQGLLGEHERTGWAQGKEESQCGVPWAPHSPPTPRGTCTNER